MFLSSQGRRRPALHHTAPEWQRPCRVRRHDAHDVKQLFFKWKALETDDGGAGQACEIRTAAEIRTSGRALSRRPCGRAPAARRRPGRTREGRRCARSSGRPAGGDPALPPSLHGGQDAQLVVHQDIVVSGITPLDVVELVLLVDVDQDVSVHGLLQSERSILRG